MEIKTNFVKMEKNFLKELDWSRLVFLFILGAILGISLKNIAAEKFTMGYDDYKLKSLKSDYSLEEKIPTNSGNENNSPETK